MSRVGMVLTTAAVAWATSLGCRSEALDPVVSPDTGEATAEAQAAATSSAAAAAAALAARPDPRRALEATGLAYVDVRVVTNLEAAITGALGPEVGRPLNQVVNRALVWWVIPHADLRPGDRIEVVYRTRPPEEPLVHAVWFTSQKMRRDFAAVRWQAEGAPYARWYQSDGSELELTLDDGPIREYEQITSLLNDGRRHKGVDFKAAVGTDVYAPWDGTIVRKNWGFRANGNCLDLEGRGMNAYFLHLSSIDPAAQPGARVKKGQRIGATGNTGRSFAPHLHYQLVRGKTVIDPFRVHVTSQKHAPAAELPKLQAELARLAQMRTQPHAPTGDL